MANISISNTIMKDIYSDDLIELIQSMIHTELEKDEDKINTDFVEECVDALIELQQEKDNGFLPLVPLVKREEFMTAITGRRHGRKQLGKAARFAIIAAVVASSTFTVNAAVNEITGVNIIENINDSIHSKLIELGLVSPSEPYIEQIDIWDDDEETTTAPVIELTTQKEEPTTNEQITEPTTQPTTQAVTQEKKPNIEQLDVWDDDDEEETTTTKPANPKPPVTAPAVKPVKDETAVFTGLTVNIDNFKTDYIYGEKIEYDKLVLTAEYSDKTSKQISLSACSYTSGIDMDKTGDYTLEITYKTSTAYVDITVRPDEETRGSQVCSNEKYDYLLTKRGAYITKYKADEEIINLDAIDSQPVYAIGARVFEDKSVREISIKNAGKLFAGAFRNCKTLKTCNSQMLTYIGDGAFDGCEALENASFKSSLSYLGAGAYKGTAITELSIPNGISEIPVSLCEDCHLLEKIDLNDIIKVGAFAFSNCEKLTTANGAGSLESVGAFAFYMDKELEFDEAPEGIKSAGSHAFEHCEKIDFGDFGKSLESVEEYAFSYCFGLKKLTINNIEAIPEGAFKGAHIENLTLGEGLKVIEDTGFMSINITSLTLPESLKKIGAYGIYSIRLKEVYFDKNIEYIGSSAFYKARNLVFYGYKDTEAESYATANSISFKYLDKEG